MDHLGIFSIHNKDNNSGNGIIDETRLEKLIKLLELDHLSEVVQEQINKPIEKHSNRFQLEGDELSCTNVSKHRILTIHDYPVNIKQYRLPHRLRDEVEKKVNELLEKGIIRPSKSPYNTRSLTLPIFLIKWVMHNTLQ